MKLKNYKKYFIRLYNYSLANGIDLVRDEEPDGGSYSPARSKITVSDELTNSTEIAIILHELGHAIDQLVLKEKDMVRLDNAYRTYYSTNNSYRRANKVLQSEMRAWRYGEAIAKRLKIHTGSWFKKAKKDCLSVYKEGRRESTKSQT